MDSLYANTNIVVLILFSLCCNGLCLLPLILSVVGVLTCTDEKAKSNAKLSLIISAIMVTIGVVANIARFALGVGGGAGGFK
jgi:glutaminase